MLKPDPPSYTVTRRPPKTIERVPDPGVKHIKLAKGEPEEETKPINSLIRSSAEFIHGFVPPDYHLDGILQRRFCYSLTGATGAGKTAISLLFAAHTALARPFGGRHVEQGRVLFLAGENPDDVRMRWMAAAEHMSFDLNLVDVHFIPGRFDINALEHRVRTEVEVLGGVSLVIVDTAAAFFLGDDENSNPQMGAYARRLREFTNLPGGPCVIVNCHPTKSASSDNLLPRGGGAFIAEVDGNLVCTKSGDACTLHWQGKFRGPDFEPISFETRSVTASTLKDSKGRFISTVIARLLTDAEQKERNATARTDEDTVLALLAETKNLSIANIASSLGWLSHRGDPQKSRVHRVIERLKADKLVAKERGITVLTSKGEEARKAMSWG